MRKSGIKEAIAVSRAAVNYVIVGDEDILYWCDVMWCDEVSGLETMKG